MRNQKKIVDNDLHITLKQMLLVFADCINVKDDDCGRARMISILICCRKRKEAELINNLCSYCIALMGNESMDSCLFSDEENWKEKNKRLKGAEIIIYEIDNFADLKKLKKTRLLYPNAELLLIANAMISPEEYLVPEVRPALLLLKPYNKQKALKIIHRMLLYYYKKRVNTAEKDRMLIKIQDEKRYLDYKIIEYFEAREKKIIISYNYEKIAFYGSLKKLEKSLPPFFVRCHRSFIVNSMYVNRIDMSKYILYIRETIVIPISKTYKKMLNDSMNRLCGKTEVLNKEEQPIDSRTIIS